MDFEALAGGIAGKAIDVWSGREAAKDERVFNREMYENRYQMTVKDLRAAGLNPALAYSQGPGSAPSAGAADTGGSMASHVSSAVQAKRLGQELSLMSAQRDRELSTAFRERDTSTLLSKQWLNEDEKTELTKAERRLVEEQIKATKYENVGRSVEAGFDSSAYGVATRAAKRVTSQIPGIGILLGGRKPKSKNRVRR